MPAKPKRKTQDELERARELLCQYVEASGVSQETLAHRVGLKPSALADILRTGGESFTITQLYQILRALGVTPRDFFGRCYGLIPVADPRR